MEALACKIMDQHEELIEVLREAESTCKKLMELAQRAEEIAKKYGNYTARSVHPEIARIARNMESLAYGKTGWARFPTSSCALRVGWTSCPSRPWRRF